MVIELGKFMDVVCLTSVGGTNVCNNIPHPHVVIGTPGCIYDLIVRKSLQTQFIKVFALDKCETVEIVQKSKITEKIMKLLNNDIYIVS